ncbi:unnamed protein product [Strongylus vulgaris]|uniref:Uncharacterized protein n=1 Tax=Strongylus vulgaris TaxID=40348 RepID=A0A3P7J019_STRVU|nr:unnamed protein product [Strongylus vulgaris]
MVFLMKCPSGPSRQNLTRKTSEEEKVNQNTVVSGVYAQIFDVQMSIQVDSRASPMKPEGPVAVEEYFFEGAEKLLELWFGNKNTKDASLRLIPRFELDAMLDIARCKVLHSAHTDYLDSYVLR